MENDTCITFPVLGEPAPDFEAETTQGPIKLSELKGKWVVMFSHPADFTPVCTTEFMAFANIYDELRSLNVHLIGLSVDSISAHLAWVHDIKEKMGVTIPFPIIADLTMKVARKYGMIHPGQSSTAAVRCVFFIDDKGIMRAMIYYPLQTLVNAGVEEILLVTGGIAMWNMGVAYLVGLILHYALKVRWIKV